MRSIISWRFRRHAGRLWQERFRLHSNKVATFWIFDMQQNAPKAFNLLFVHTFKPAAEVLQVLRVERSIEPTSGVVRATMAQMIFLD